jgi:hypothetical protein
MALIVAPDRDAAGAPFLTDAPEPTETGHWELYAPPLDASGKGRDYDGAFGVELNYAPHRTCR